MFDNGEFLVSQMSSAAKMIDLLKTNEKIQQKLEESLSALKENNIELDNLSKSDALTGIRNRRGFYLAADEMLKQFREEGDFSLKLIGKILTEIVDERGVTGRIGGDEYACIVCGDAKDCEEKFVKKITRAFDNFNDTSDKEYNITVSIGTYLLKSDMEMSLHDALSHADESLYQAKKYRIKDVTKIQR